MDIESGTLWRSLIERERSARASGALQPIATVETSIEDAGVRFIVRGVSTLARKNTGGGAAGPRIVGDGNPFLPPEPALTVGNVSPTHCAVLNKHPVVDHHLLVVTRRFVPQERLLDAADCGALAWCLAEFDGLAFYNGGKVAGASQPHKHLQFVPLPLGAGPWEVPMEAVFDTWSAAGGVLRLLHLPFAHAFALLEPRLFDDRSRAADRIAELYFAQMHAIGVAADEMAVEQPQQAGPYNLLVTRRWMLTVPRSREMFGTISINALGFAGSLFVRTAGDMGELREAGPMNVLRAIGS